ncbi:Protein of unknown function [Pyronema omphalodes CBS 100304]|uniref:Uncharacterized protein n=1 Tax=Pyronema omphalodes (strain CBS 100304) TaxID=1076935 RepID=U4KY05_PYROM|nr:Protein of unknown function [Pyronema omphalodes CBS 100304]
MLASDANRGHFRYSLNLLMTISPYPHKSDFRSCRLAMSRPFLTTQNSIPAFQSKQN